MASRVARAEATDSGWRSLYRGGGAAALIAAVLFRRNLDMEFYLARIMGIIGVGPTMAPSTSLDWFTLLQSYPLLGLTLLDLFDVVNYALVGLIYLALCGALRRANPGAMAVVAPRGSPAPGKGPRDGS